MNTRSPKLFAALLAFAACDDGGPAFLSLSELCRRHAENVCAAREDCCEQPPSRSDCQAAEQNSCVALRKALEKEGALDYDAARASRVLDDQQQALDGCGEPFPIGRYFSGTLALGDVCERDAECASDRCDPELAVCVRRDELLLCPAPAPEE